MDWKTFEGNGFILRPGMVVKFRQYSKFYGLEGLIERPLSRYGQRNIACTVNGKAWRLPVAWISEYKDDPNYKPVAVARPTVKKGRFWNEMWHEDFCLMYRNGGHFDVVQFKYSKQTRVYCLNPLNGKTYGYDPAWFVCKIPPPFNLSESDKVNAPVESDWPESGPDCEDGTCEGPH